MLRSSQRTVGTHCSARLTNVTRSYRDTCWEWTLCNHRVKIGPWNQTHAHTEYCRKKLLLQKEKSGIAYVHIMCLMLELTYRYNLLAYFEMVGLAENLAYAQ